MGVVNSEFESCLRLKRLICLTSHTKRSASEIISDELAMRVTPKVNFSGLEGIVEVGIKVFAKNDAFEAEVVMQGSFELLGCEEGTELYDELTKRNTVAIIFPFIRSQIALITSQPDMPPVVIPAININALLDGIESQGLQSE